MNKLNISEYVRPSVLALITANLVPLYGVVVLGWKVFPVILLFWVENVIIGVLNVLKILFAAPSEAAIWFGKIFLIPFFCVHYGMFTAVHGMFVIGFFGSGFLPGASLPNVDIVLNIVRVEHLQWPILGLMMSHGISFLLNYIGQGEYRRASVSALMQQPYGRVIVMHVTILGGGFLLMAMQSPVAGLILLLTLKIALDVRAHLRERRKFAPTLSDETPTAVLT